VQDEGGTKGGKGGTGVEGGTEGGTEGGPSLTLCLGIPPGSKALRHSTFTLATSSPRR